MQTLEPQYCEFSDHSASLMLSYGSNADDECTLGPSLAANSLRTVRRLPAPCVPRISPLGSRWQSLPAHLLLDMSGKTESHVSPRLLDSAMHALGIEDPSLSALLNSASCQRLLGGTGERAAASATSKAAESTQDKSEHSTNRRRRASRRDRADSLGAFAAVPPRCALPPPDLAGACCGCPVQRVLRRGAPTVGRRM